MESSHVTQNWLWSYELCNYEVLDPHVTRNQLYSNLFCQESCWCSEICSNLQSQFPGWHLCQERCQCSVIWWSSGIFSCNSDLVIQWRILKLYSLGNPSCNSETVCSDNFHHLPMPREPLMLRNIPKPSAQSPGRQYGKRDADAHKYYEVMESSYVTWNRL